MQLFATLFSFATLALAASRTAAPSGALVVGSGQKYTTISKAVAALSASTTSEQIIFIQPGTYKEQVYIPKLKGPLTVYGYTADDTSYAGNKVIITAGESQKTKPNNDATATLRVWTSSFKMYNVNVKNSFGKGSQALALSANAGEQGYYACGFFGYQDTVLAQSGAQMYARTYIEGATDFIFGQKVQAWFEKCTIGVVSSSLGYITASGRSSADNGYFVISNSNVAAAPGNTVSNGAYYLGRPWGAYARVIVQNTKLSAVVNAAGWRIWNTGDERTDHVTFQEYNNSGTGASGARAGFMKKVSSAISMSTVLGSGYASAKYIDSKFL